MNEKEKENDKRESSIKIINRNNKNEVLIVSSSKN